MTALEGDIKTSKKILMAARYLFLEKGFSSVSIRDIAKKANVPISLIYHYYENKIALWKATKSDLLDQYFVTTKQDPSLEFSSLKEFLTHVMTLRFKFYDQDPNIARLISWQRLEPLEESLEGINTPTLIFDLTPYIKTFQEKGQVRSDLDPEIINYLITTTSSTLFFDKPPFLYREHAEEKKEQFLHMIIECLYRLCSTAEN